MKHKISVTIALLSLFLITQIVGLFVIYSYAPINLEVTYPKTNTSEIIKVDQPLPFGLEPPKEDAKPTFLSLILAFILAFAIISALMKYNLKLIMRVWFFTVVVLAIGITLNAVLKNYAVYASIIAILLAASLAYLKMFKPNVYSHNLTEILIYPGIAAVFIPILSPITVIILLIIISIYDMWAVWHSGVMQKMAKYQMEELNIFGGFLLTSASKKVKEEIKKIKQKYKGRKIPKRIENRKYNVKVAILGGGDVVFPIITAGVFYNFFGLISALFVVVGSFIGLTTLFILSEKKAYPAMPYITAGIFASLVLWMIIF